MRFTIPFVFLIFASFSVAVANAQSSIGENAIKASADDKATATAYAALAELPFTNGGGSFAFTVNKTNGFHEWASHSTSYFGLAGTRFRISEALAIQGRVLSDMDPGGTGAQAAAMIIETGGSNLKFQFHASAARSLNNTSAPGVNYNENCPPGLENKVENACGNISSYGINGSDYVVGVGMAFVW